MEQKFRILENKFDDLHSEFHPQILIGSYTYTPNIIKKLFGFKSIIYPERWQSLLMGTNYFKCGVSLKYEAEVIIQKFRNKKIIEEIIHEIK